MYQVCDTLSWRWPLLVKGDGEDIAGVDWPGRAYLQ